MKFRKIKVTIFLFSLLLVFACSKEESDVGEPNQNLIGKSDVEIFSVSYDLKLEVGSGTAAFGDFNKDGNVDIMVPFKINGNLHSYLGKGDGKFSKAVKYKITKTSFTIGYETASADLNGDGNLDFLSRNSPSTFDSIEYNLGDGNGGFADSISVTSEVPITNNLSGSIVNFDDDGRKDIVTDTYLGSGDNLMFLSMNDLGEFVVKNEIIGVLGDVSFRKYIDLNNDGYMDIVASDLKGVNGAITLTMGSGVGEFAESVRNVLLDYFNLSTEIFHYADMNNDSIIDIIKSKRRTIKGEKFLILYVFYVSSEGAISEPKELVSISTDRADDRFSISLGDYDNNGMNDIAVIARRDSRSKVDQIFIGKQMRNGVFDISLIEYDSLKSSDYSFSRLYTRDVNNDGFDDLIVFMSFKSDILYRVFMGG